MKKNTTVRVRKTLKLLFLAFVIANVAFIAPLFVRPVQGQSSLMNTGVVVGREKDVGIPLVKKAGIGWITTAVRFNENFASVYAEAKRNGVMILGSLDYWTFERKIFTLDDWSKAVKKAASKYPAIRAWDIWNEPTLEKWKLAYMDGSPEHYVEMLKVAYPILKAANPNNVVLGLGGAQLGIPMDVVFARKVFSLGGGDYMDGISIHAYAKKLNNGVDWKTYKQLWTQDITQYKQFNKPLWLTETGFRSDQKSDADQVSYMAATFQFFVEQGFKAYFWYHIKDYKDADGSVVAYGLVRMDLTAKPSYEAYQKLQK